MKFFLILLRKINQNLFWLIHNVYKLPSHQLISSVISKDDNISIIIPHADDELIGNYSILNNYKPVLFYYRKYGSNINIDNIQKRDKELEVLAKKFNLKIEIIDNENNLKEALLRNKITTVFIPPIVDWHDEHVDISKILLKALSNSKIQVFSYEISVPIMSTTNLFISLYSPLSCLNKWKIFKEIYKSQSNIPISRFVLKDLYVYGFKIVFCDKFYLIEKLNYKSIQPNIDLKTQINNLKQIRNISRYEWEKIEI